jgi:hypothetical protein
MCYNINDQYASHSTHQLRHAVCGANYQPNSGDVIVLHTIFYYINNVVEFHLPDRVRFYKEVSNFL